jgi:hypothetical protein
MNREKLAQLIYWMRSFTEEDLSKAVAQRSYKAENGSALSVHDFLENLKRTGVLAFEGGRYLLLNPAKRQRVAA